MADTRPLRELASVIRSKNAKPFRLTLDVLFSDRELFEYVKRSGALTVDTVAAAYRLPRDRFTSAFVFDAGMAFKFTLRRPLTQGTVGDSDVYGAQQHAPLLDIAIPWASDAPARQQDTPNPTEVA